MSDLTQVIHVRVDDDDFRWVKGVADGRGQSSSAYIRDLIQEKRAGRILPETVAPSPLQDALPGKRKFSAIPNTLVIPLDGLADRVKDSVLEDLGNLLSSELKSMGKPGSSDDFARRLALEALLDVLRRK